MLEWVNERTIGNKRYTVLRDSADPRVQYLLVDNVTAEGNAVGNAKPRKLNRGRGEKIRLIWNSKVLETF